MKHRPHWRQASALPGTGAITVGEGGELHRFPGCLAPLGPYSRGLTRMSLASLVMASSSPRCENRQLSVHVYPGGSKAPGAERITVSYGRRGRPVKKPRFIPARLAHQLARSSRPSGWAPWRCCEPPGAPAPGPGGPQAHRGFSLLSKLRLTPLPVPLQRGSKELHPPGAAVPLTVDHVGYLPGLEPYGDGKHQPGQQEPDRVGHQSGSGVLVLL